MYLRVLMEWKIENEMCTLSINVGVHSKEHKIKMI
jgi:hypothetical protein